MLGLRLWEYFGSPVSVLMAFLSFTHGCCSELSGAVLALGRLGCSTHTCCSKNPFELLAQVVRHSIVFRQQWLKVELAPGSKCSFCTVRRISCQPMDGAVTLPVGKTGSDMKLPFTYLAWEHNLVMDLFSFFNSFLFIYSDFFYFLFFCPFHFF